MYEDIHRCSLCNKSLNGLYSSAGSRRISVLLQKSEENLCRGNDWCPVFLPDSLCTYGWDSDCKYFASRWMCLLHDLFGVWIKAERNSGKSNFVAVSCCVFSRRIVGYAYAGKKERIFDFSSFFGGHLFLLYVPGLYFTGCGCEKEESLSGCPVLSGKSTVILWII